MRFSLFEERQNYDQIVPCHLLSVPPQSFFGILCSAHFVASMFMIDTGFVLSSVEVLFLQTRINLFPGLFPLRPCSLMSMFMKTAFI